MERRRTSAFFPILNCESRRRFFCGPKTKIRVTCSRSRWLGIDTCYLGVHPPSNFPLCCRQLNKFLPNCVGGGGQVLTKSKTRHAQGSCSETQIWWHFCYVLFITAWGGIFLALNRDCTIFFGRYWMKIINNKKVVQIVLGFHFVTCLWANLLFVYIVPTKGGGVHIYCLSVFCRPHVGGSCVRGDILRSGENWCIMLLWDAQCTANTFCIYISQF